MGDLQLYFILLTYILYPLFLFVFVRLKVLLLFLGASVVCVDKLARTAELIL